MFFAKRGALPVTGVSIAVKMTLLLGIPAANEVGKVTVWPMAEPAPALAVRMS